MGYYSDPTAAKGLSGINREFSRLEKKAKRLKQLHKEGRISDRELEDARIEADPGYKRFLTTSIVTARSAPADARIVATLRSWNIVIDQTFLLGGLDKGRVLSILKPHIFFDDQRHPHLESSSAFTPSVHVPFGVLNS